MIPSNPDALCTQLRRLNTIGELPSESRLWAPLNPKRKHPDDVIAHIHVAHLQKNVLASTQKRSVTDNLISSEQQAACEITEPLRRMRYGLVAAERLGRQWCLDSEAPDLVHDRSGVQEIRQVSRLQADTPIDFQDGC